MNATEQINDAASTIASGTVEILQVDDEIASILPSDYVGINCVRSSFMKTHWAAASAHFTTTDQEDYEERGSKDRAASTCGPTVTHSTIRADVGVAIVPQTISRHLAEANLKFKRPFRALSLTPEHRQLRLQWCQARSMWNVTDWQNVVFSDESRFVWGTDDNRVRVWRHPGELYSSPHNVLRHTARTAGVMVWGAIAYDSRSNLIVMRGTLTGQRYFDDILRPHVGAFLNGLPGATFQQDNARPHKARVAQDFLHHFQTVPWPARTPICSL
ncbi:transposable element Tcb2 transposase [Trichonephila clavipes]|nr:transposable element Tcb2 transposase [Trichonephila clavipes]